MKKIKKISALALIFTMILTSFSLISVVAKPLNEPIATSQSELVDFENCTVTKSDGTAVTETDGTITMNGTENGETFSIGNRLVLIITGTSNKAEITTDSVSNSKALKITYSGSGKIDMSHYFLESKADVKDGSVVRTGASVRFDSFANNAKMDRFGMLRSTDGYSGSQTALNLAYYFDSFRIGNSYNDSSSSTFFNFNDGTAKTSYLDYTISYNQNTDEGTAKGSIEHSRTIASAVCPGFAAYCVQAGNDGPDTDTTQTVVWFDNMWVETIKYGIQTVSVGGTFYDEDNTALANVPLNAPIDVKFNAPVSSDSAKNDNFSLTDSNGTSVNFTVVKESENVIAVYPEKQKINTTYTLTVKGGVASAEDKLVKTSSDSTYSYTTCSNYLSFKGYIENENFNDIEADTLTFTDSNLNENTAPVKDYLNDKLNGKIGVFRYNAGDSLSVATDSVTKSKALKISRPQENNSLSNTRITYVLPQTYNSGKIVTSAELRIDRNGNQDHLSSLMSYVSSTTTISWNDDWKNNQGSGSGYYWDFCGSNSNWFYWGQVNDKTSFPMTQTLDFTSKTISGQTYRNYGLSEENRKQSLQTKTKANAITDTDDVYGMNIVNLNASAVTTATGGTDIYFDNFKVAYYDIVEPEVEMPEISEGNMQAIRFRADGTYVNRALEHNSNGLQLTLEGTTDGTTWETIDLNSGKHAVEYRALFNIAKVSETGFVTRIYAENGDGIVPVLAAYKNANGSVVTTKTNVICYPENPLTLGTKYEYSEGKFAGTGTFSDRSDFDTIKADDEHKIDGRDVVDTYKYYETVKDNDDVNPIQTYSQINPALTASSVLEYWFYDTGDSDMRVTIEDGDTANARNFSFTVLNGTEKYCVEDTFSETEKYDTEISRSKGWHQVTLMLWGGSTNKDDAQQHVVGYIDGECVYDKAVSQVQRDCMWQSIEPASEESKKAFVSEVLSYKTRVAANTAPVLLDVELVNFVKNSSDNKLLGIRYDNTNYGHSLTYNPDNLSNNNAYFDVFFNYYLPGTVQKNGRISAYTQNNGTTGNTSSNEDGTVSGGKSSSFLAKNGVANSYNTSNPTVIRISVNGGVNAANTGNGVLIPFTFDYKTNAPITSGGCKLSQPLLYGQDTTTGYYHDITEDGVIGYKKVKAGVRYMNYYDEDVTLYVAVAQYEKGKLVNIYFENATFTKANVKDITHEFEVKDSANTEFKTFVWTSEHQPYADNNNTTAEAYTFGPFGRK